MRFEDGHALWEGGVRIPIRPCLGTIGVAPAGEGIATIMPGDHGGNLDTADVASGATIYFPVRVRGALLAMGDPKAAMGDGEVCGTGIGVPVRVEATLRLLRGVPLRRPCSRRPPRGRPWPARPRWTRPAASPSRTWWTSWPPPAATPPRPTCS